jgi:hypothetical protein
MAVRKGFILGCHHRIEVTSIQWTESSILEAGKNAAYKYYHSSDLQIQASFTWATSTVQGP